VTPTLSEATCVLSKLAYLMLCRSIQLLALLARSDTTKDLEILAIAAGGRHCRGPGGG
jgi:hypothetical protein